MRGVIVGLCLVACNAIGQQSIVRVQSFVSALQGRDYQKTLDLTFATQHELARLRSSNPKVLWDKLIREYYDKQLAAMRAITTEMDAIRAGGNAMVGDPRGIYPQMLAFLPPTAVWSVSEVRAEQPNVISDLSGAGRPRSVETAYVTVRYPNTADAPAIDQQYRLQQAILAIRLRDGLVHGIWRVKEGDVEAPNSRAAFEQTRNNETLRIFVADGYPASNCEELLKKGANANTVDRDGSPLVLIAARRADPRWLEPISNDVIKALLRAGANPNQTNRWEQSALGWAAFKLRTDIVQTLLSAGALPNIPNVDGYTPVHHVVQGYLETIQKSQGHAECSRYIGTLGLLKQAGADLKLKNKEGKSAYDIAREAAQAEVAGRLRDGCAAAIDRALGSRAAAERP